MIRAQDNGLFTYIDSNGTANSNAHCPVLYSVNPNNPTGNYPSLSFSDVGSVKGLLSKYYLNYIARKSEAFVRRNYIRLFTIDLLDFTFRKKVLIGSDLYIIQKLEAFNPIKAESVEHYLVPDTQATTDTQNLINNSIVKTNIIPS